MNILKSCFLRYFNKKEIHNNPITKDIKIPIPKIAKFSLIIVRVLSLSKLNKVAPATTGTDK